MIALAGPPGSGKSSVFPVADAGVDYFNIDDRAAALNGGSYQNISPEIRAQANRECERFIAAHIRETESFAVSELAQRGITRHGIFSPETRSVPPYDACHLRSTTAALLWADS